MHGTDERIRYIPLIPAANGRIHLHKAGIFFKRRKLVKAGFFQDQSGFSCFSHAGRSINNHMLGIRSAKRGTEQINSFFLPDDIIKP
jgi:hypothetical protein